ncbi:putative retrovirus polyprotein [Sclerotinia borealis F-4128]|uniref:Putative retrovirus polyprotein n=1 Tax=Sclerotinia borealis (strain F-4128) TaxID=1432307 RepID=W9CA18_SCLBF|nr:putative retrovirus polyprotein [Sclerotinia borealis F-4128]
MEIAPDELQLKRFKLQGAKSIYIGCKVEVVKNWKAPKTVKSVHFGFCNLYRRFIRDFGRLAKPLNHLTKGTVQFRFDEKCVEAFEAFELALTTSLVIAHYNTELESMIKTVASDGVVAGVLSRWQPNSEWHPVACFSKTMTPAECNYEIHDKEMLGIVKSLDAWRPELEGLPTRLQVFTDHKALEYFMITKRFTAPQASWTEHLSQFYFTIMDRSGKQNGKADVLMRLADEAQTQDELKDHHHTRALLFPESLESQMITNLGIFELDLCPVAVDDAEPLFLVESADCCR